MTSQVEPSTHVQSEGLARLTTNEEEKGVYVACACKQKKDCS